MELLGEVSIKAPRERVWTALNDAQVLKACIPGCESVIDESPDTRRATVMVKIGPVRARFSGKVAMSEMLAPERCVMRFEGSGGAAGMASGSAQVQLSSEGAQDAGTKLSYSVNASVGGKLGQIGGRMIDASAKQLSDQFFVALRNHLEPAPAAGAVADAPVGTVAPLPSSACPSTVAEGCASVQSTDQAQPRAANLMSKGEASRIAWFAMGVLMGAATTGLGVWLGARFFH